MKADVFLKEYEQLRKDFAVPNRFSLFVESVIRALSRTEEKLENEQAIRRAALDGKI